MTSSLPDYFQLFGLPQRFAIDPPELTRAYREVLGQVHPDRHAAASAADRRAAVQLASHANQAYETLRSDCARAEYLCGLRGATADVAGARIDPAFLEQQMQWRETLERAQSRGDYAAAVALAGEVARIRRGLVQDIGYALDERNDAAGAARAVRSLMFVDKLLDQIRDLAPDPERASIDGA